MAKEAALVRACLHLLSVYRVFAFRNNTGAFKTARGHFMRFGYPGSGDILGLLDDGTFLSVECKRPGGRPTKDQLKFKSEIEKNNGVALIVWSVDQLEKELKNYL